VANEIDLDGCDLVLVYATFPDRAAALDIGRRLVEGQLAGCINILPAMTSVYVWDGKIETAEEAVLIAKTRRAAADAVVSAIKAQHSYQVPAILIVPVVGGNSDYIDWLRSGTAAP
jgi:periplasmic divalent cation tolerance protein